MICQSPGSIHRSGGAEATSTKVNSVPAPAAGKNCSTAMRIIASAMVECTRRERVTVCTAIKAADTMAVESQIIRYSRTRLAGFGSQTACTPARQQSNAPGRSERCGAVAAELRTARHLPADVTNVSERSVEVVHSKFTLQCKVTQLAAGVNITEEMNRLARVPRSAYPSSVTGETRKQFGKGKQFGVRGMIPLTSKCAWRDSTDRPS